MSLINCCANKSPDWSRLLNGTRRRTKTNLGISRTNQSEAIKKMKFLAGKSLFTINMQSSFLFSHLDAWSKGDIGKWRYLEVSTHTCDLFRWSLTSDFRESSVCKVFSGCAHTRAATLSQAELGPNSSAALDTRHVFHNSSPPGYDANTMPFLRFTFGLKWIKNYEAQNIRK